MVLGMIWRPSADAVGLRPFPQTYLTDAQDSRDMTVNGSVTPVDFSIRAQDDCDIWITMVQVVIVDSVIQMSSFGNLAQLANGCEIVYIDDSGETVLASPIRTNFELIVASDGPWFGSGPQAFEAINVEGMSDAILPRFDFAQRLPPWGLRLRARTSHRLTLRVRDDLTAMVRFDAVASSYQLRC